MKRFLYTKTKLIVFVSIFISSCSNTKHLPAGDTLFRGSKIFINDKETSAKDKRQLKNDLAGLVRPRPNTKFMGWRLKLSLYNLAGGDTKKKRGLKQWLRNKVGEPPVLTSSLRASANRELMENFLQNKGFFYARAKSKLTTKRKRSLAVFDITTGPQYTINKVFFRKDSTLISYDIDSDFSKTLLKQGSPYNLDLIKAERQRIDRMLKEKGYFFFKADYVLVLVDTNIGEHKVNMYVKLKYKEIPDEAYNSYIINDIYIYANYRLKAQSQDTSKANKVVIDNYYIIDNRKSFKPFIFSQALLFEKGDEYSLDDQNMSLSRLVNMGTFKFVKSRFDAVNDSLLDVYYYLTPFPKKSLKLELGALTQNDNRTGTRASLSWHNRNAFRGAEDLMFKVNGGIETQYGGTGQQPNIYNLGVEVGLSFPRFVVPFFDIQGKSRFLPRSIVKLKYGYESELSLLSIYTYTASYGYDWKESLHKEHQLYPINFTYVKTDTLGNTEKLHLLYGNLIFNGIIFGPTYEYTYNSQNGPTKTSGFYFDGLIDLSGNLVGLAQNASYGKKPQTVFGDNYAQYIKLQPDLRYYWLISKTSIIAARIMTGIGIPYGNSNQLPNIKQFWAGGNSDLRGFPSRLVGPGTFNEYTQYSTNQYLETLGDLKLEFNLELRQNVYKFINAALFAEAGNIWLYNDNPAYPGGVFTSNFYKQLATDVGFGLRLDFSILLLRFDFGIPVQKPWLSQNGGFTFNQFNIKDAVLNIGIGYPF